MSNKATLHLKPDYLIDTRAINERMREANRTPLRWRECSYTVPLGATAAQKASIATDAIKGWLQVMAKRGWTQWGKIVVQGPYPAVDILSQATLLDCQEWRARCVFEKEKVKPVRIELDPRMVKQAPDHTITLREAAKIHGLV